MDKTEDMNKEETITIPKSRYDFLMKQVDFIDALLGNTSSEVDLCHQCVTAIENYLEKFNQKNQ